MKLHLGSGNRYREGWTNVDLYAERADVREDLRTVSFPPESVTEVNFIHCIEHFSRPDGLAICAKVHSWLRTGGTFVVETPNRPRCIQLCGSKVWKKRVNGAKGLMGGRGCDKQIWNQWLLDNAAAIADGSVDGIPPTHMAPQEFHVPGQDHLYIWSPDEFKSELERIGFSNVTTGIGEAHGARWGRDFRATGVKP